MRHPLPASQRDNTAGETPRSTCGGRRGEGGSCGEVVVVKTTSAGASAAAESRQRRCVSRRWRVNIALTAWRAPPRLKRGLASHPETGTRRPTGTRWPPGHHCRAPQGQPAAATGVTSALRLLVFHREYSPDGHHNTQRAPRNGARKAAATGGAESRRKLGLWHAIGSASAHRQVNRGSHEPHALVRPAPPLIPAAQRRPHPRPSPP